MTVRHRAGWGRLSDLQTFGLLMAAGAVAFPMLPDLGVLCPLRRVTGIPCPMCGSTTAVLHLARAEPLQALAANPLGVLIAVCCIAAFLPARVLAPMGARLTSWRNRLGRRATVGITVVVFGALWLYELRRFGRL